MLKILFIIIFVFLIYYFAVSKQKIKKSGAKKNNFIKENYIRTFNNTEIESVVIPVKFNNSFDWATNNNQYRKPCLTPVRDQGRCGCCYAMVIIAMVESAYYRYILPNTQTIQVLSGQQIIDCLSSKPTNSYKTPCEGCVGCNTSNALQLYFGGLPVNVCTEDDYPSLYKYQTDNSSEVGGKITLYNYPGCLQQQYCGANNNFKAVTIPTLDIFQIKINENQLKKAIYSLGPLYWAVLVPDSIRFQFYALTGGIYSGKLSKDPDNSHAVIITGWGIRNILGTRRKYWIIQNSWGRSWANKGFMWVPRSDSGRNGIYGYQNISEDLYCVQVQKPVCEGPSAKISILQEPIFLPNNISKVKFSVEVYIPDVTYYIVYQINSTDNYLQTNGITDVNSNVIHNLQKIVDNENNYRCYQQGKKIIQKCDFKNWFYYDIEIDAKQILTNDWKISVQVFDKTLGLRPLKETTANIRWSFINIIINNIETTTDTINYNVIETKSYISDINGATLYLFKVNKENNPEDADIIYQEKLDGIFTMGNFTKTISQSSVSVSIGNGIYQFFIVYDDNSKDALIYSNPFKI